jgi:sugar phosphate isomerase/epimerase
VPSLGYDAVEMAGTYNWPADKWQELLAETKLAVVGGHGRYDELTQNLDVQIAFAKAVGSPRLVMSWMPESMRTVDGYRATARLLNSLGQRARAAGSQFFYHNHAFEFDRLPDGSCGMDILVRETDPTLIAFEIDTYWVERGGRDSRQFIEQHADRIGMIHAKELRKRDNADVPAGQGDVDFKFIIPLARQRGWPVVVEYEGDNAIASVTESARYLRTLMSR